MRWTDHDPRSHRPTLYTRITFSYLSFPLLRSLAPLSNELCFAPSSRKFGYEITGAGRLSSSAPSDIMRESARARCPKTKEGRGTSETRPARVSSRSISSLLETNQSFSQGNEIYCEYIYTHNATLEHEDGARNIRFTIRNQMYAFVLPIAFSGNHRSPYSFRKEKCSRYSAKYVYIYMYVCIRANWSASITTNSRFAD